MEEDKKQKIIKAVLDKKISLKEIADNLFITELHLKLLLGSWGVELPQKRRYNRMSVPKREELMELYKKYGKTSKLAEHFNVGVNTVNKWMRSLNIPTRKMKMTKDDKVRFLEEHLNKINSINF